MSPLHLLSFTQITYCKYHIPSGYLYHEKPIYCQKGLTLDNGKKLKETIFQLKLTINGNAEDEWE